MFTCALGREEHGKQTSLAWVGCTRSVWASLKPAHRVGAFLIYTTQAPGCSAGVLSKAGARLCALPTSKLLRLESQVLHKGTDSVGPAFCALPWYEHSGDQVLGERTLSKWAVHLITSLVPATPFAGCAACCSLRHAVYFF